MVVSDFTKKEIDYLLDNCNFSPLERPLFLMRAQGMVLSEIAEEMNISVDYARKISQKVNRKIIRVIRVN